MPPSDSNKKKKHPVQHLLAGGCAGFVEASVCHPLDTIKTRMQLRRQQATPVNQVVVKMKSSLVEPALRLKHSLQEPLVKTAAGGGLHEPGLRLSGAGAVATETVHIKAGGATALPSQVAAAAAPAPAGTVRATLGPIGTARRIVQREGFGALYKGLTAVWTGIVPKMAIRFVSFEQYREWLTALCATPTLATWHVSSTSITFTAGLASGLTEAIMVVTPAEVCKIRMQSQYHSMMDPAAMQHRKYTNVLQTGYVIVKEEGLGALYKGLIPTMLRQGCNQATNFTAYNLIKQKVMEMQGTSQLEHWQSLCIGAFSGACGPMVNNPLDVVKTRLQKQVVVPGKPPKYTGLMQACVVIAREEGFFALWKGITPRLLRISPGQAITFMTYEAVSNKMNQFGWFEQH